MQFEGRPLLLELREREQDPIPPLSAFAGLSLALLVAFRERLRAKLRPAAAGFGDALVGETGVARETLAPGARGNAELRGTTWTAHNVGAEPIPAGARLVVDRSEGVVLHVRRAD